VRIATDNNIMKFFNTFLGISMIVLAGISDLIFLTAVVVVFVGPVDFVAIAMISACLYLWIMSPMKPFDCWKPSVIKNFWKNWNS
jgi:hypothetical protein